MGLATICRERIPQVLQRCTAPRHTGVQGECRLGLPMQLLTAIRNKVRLASGELTGMVAYASAARLFNPLQICSSEPFVALSRVRNESEREGVKRSIRCMSIPTNS